MPVGQICGDQNTAVVTSKGTGVFAQAGACRDVERTRQLAVSCLVDGFDQHLPHATGRASDRNPMR
jgi:hypothetical protein